MADETITQAPAATPFFSAWRPLVGWVSLTALLIKFVIVPVIGIVLVLAHHPSESISPNLNFSDLMTLMGTAIGFGGMRTMEKMKGVVK